jgi:uncharacterized membrane protein YwaF
LRVITKVIRQQIQNVVSMRKIILIAKILKTVKMVNTDKQHIRMEVPLALISERIYLS